MEFMGSMKRSCYCAELDAKDIGKEVTVMGWVAKARNLGSLVFIDLRDKSGIVQLFANDSNAEILEKAASLHQEYVIAASGTVQKRGGAVNPNIPTGEIEINISELKLLSKSEVTPFVVEEDVKAKDELRLKYRYLDLRRHCMQEQIVARHRVTRIARDYYDANGFLEIETPYLTKSTPEGARDYLVPSRVHKGKFYALPQSPQQYKQLLMVAGFDRYMQIVRCFRDEDLRADRQPEFTQLDLEMSFVTEEDVMTVNEGFIKKLMKEHKGMDVKTPFPRITWKEAMDRFGSDKPDTRFGMELKDISDLVKDSEFSVFKNAVSGGGSVRAISTEGHVFSRKEIDALTEFVKTYRAKGMVYISYTEEGVKSSAIKFLSEDLLAKIAERTGAKMGDTLFIVADKDKVVFDALGALRVEVAKRRGILDPNTFNYLWVTEFPLLEYDEEAGRFFAMHHPFTSPMDEDIEYLSSDPGRVRAKAYDIVLNGIELGGGSIRINNTELQTKMFECLGFTKESAEARFGYLLEAFKYGVPPHGGMAYGLDRLCMLLQGLDNIRDVIAFPKVQNASELMTNAPDVVDEEQLEELSISIKNNTEA
ncbi:MAG: aspartate--tRNA ligase [Bacillota bacterium]|nr:aspartate--tRNA ligase [Bacillota bacterium]